MYFSPHHPSDTQKSKLKQRNGELNPCGWWHALTGARAEQEFCNLVNAEERCEDRHAAACAVCSDGGDLLCCDACPTAVHPACIGLEAIPEASSRSLSITCIELLMQGHPDGTHKGSCVPS